MNRAAYLSLKAAVQQPAQRPALVTESAPVNPVNLDGIMLVTLAVELAALRAEVAALTKQVKELSHMVS